MTDTTDSGPTESVSQTISVYILSIAGTGSYLQSLKYLSTPPHCIISTTVTSKRHLAKAYLNISFDTGMCSYLTVYYNSTSKAITTAGKYYFDPNVTSVATYTHSNLSINRKYYARAYIYINGTYTYGA